MGDEPLVSAEVLLRDAAEAETVAAKIEQLELKVVSIGSRSISVQAPKDRFESLFEVRLAPATPEDSPGNDFGPLGEAALRPTEPPSVPAELRDEVESVEVQQPPLLF